MKTPREYRHDANLVNEYNRGYKAGYNGETIPTTWKTDEERLAFHNGHEDGKKDREEVYGNIGTDSNNHLSHSFDSSF